MPSHQIWSWRKHVPNFLSCLRIVLAFAFLFIAPEYRLITIFVALASEFLDGFLARRWNAVTKLGIALDPIADKFFVLATVAVLLMERKLLWYQFALVAMRDITVAIGAFSILIETGKGKLPVMPPRYSGKITTTFQFALLISLYAGFGFTYPLYVATAIVSCVSAVDYMYGVMHRRFDRPQEAGGALSR